MLPDSLCSDEAYILPMGDRLCKFLSKFSCYLCVFATRFRCKDCGFGPAVSSVVYRHMLDIHGKSINPKRQALQCSACPYRSLLPSCMRRHISDKHNKEIAQGVPIKAEEGGDDATDEMTSVEIVEGSQKWSPRKTRKREFCVHYFLYKILLLIWNFHWSFVPTIIWSCILAYNTLYD